MGALEVPENNRHNCFTRGSCAETMGKVAEPHPLGLMGTTQYRLPEWSWTQGRKISMEPRVAREAVREA